MSCYTPVRGCKLVISEKGYVKDQKMMVGWNSIEPFGHFWRIDRTLFISWSNNSVGMRAVDYFFSKFEYFSRKRTHCRFMTVTNNQFALCSSISL